MQPNERLPNNVWGWLKVAVNAIAAGAVGFGTGGPAGAGAGIFLNLWGLFQHTPANTALAPAEIIERAQVQIEKKKDS